MKKKLAFVVLCLILALSFSSAAFAGEITYSSEEDADSSSGYISVSYENPLYSDEEIRISESENKNAKTVDASDDVTYMESEDELIEALREALVERQTTITLYYKSGEAPTSALLSDVFDGAIEHTGVPDEGDYLKWQYYAYTGGISYSYSSLKSIYTMTITYSVTYYTTAEQEAAVDSAVAQIVEDLNLANLHDYEAVSAIYDYICSTVSYDNDNLNDDSYTLKFTAYAALINKTAVCQGYSLLFYRLCLEAGIDARIIAGSTSNGDHGWNIVNIDGTYYYSDTTWDAGNTEYKYFLKGSDNFTDHVSWSDYSVIEAQYNISSSDFDADSYTPAHTYDSGVVTKEASSTTDGIITYTCTVCGDTYTETIPATGEDGLAYDSSTGLWGYYVNGVLDTSYTGLASNSAGTWYVENGIVDFGYTGLAEVDGTIYYISSSKVSTNTGLYKISGTWYYFVNGAVASDFTGIVSNSAGSWYVEDGIVDFGYTGLATVDGVLYYISYSKVSTNTGLYKFNGIWYYFESGAVDYDYTGLVKNSAGWWYVEDSIVDFDYTGLVEYNGSYWYVYDSNVKFVTGLYKINGTWYYIVNGAAAFSYTGIVSNSAGSWYVEDGIVDFAYTGLATVDGTIYYISSSKVSTNTGLYKISGTWYYFVNGAVASDFTGLVSNSAGTWYVENGIVDFEYNGTVTIDGVKYTIKNSKVVS